MLFDLRFANAPVRRSARGAELSTIPNEIYVEIFSYLSLDAFPSKGEWRRSLLRISFACRLFCTILFPKIFHRVEYDMGLGFNDHVVSFLCRKLVMEDSMAKSIAPFVKECVIHDSTVMRSDGLKHDSFLLLFLRAVRMMPRLTGLSLHRVDLTRKVVQHLKKLEHVKELNVQQTSFGSNTSLSDLLNSLEPTMLILQCSQNSDDRMDAHEFQFSVDKIQIFQCDDETYDITTHLLKQPFAASLRILDITPDFDALDAFIMLLNKTPTITALHLGIQGCDDLWTDAEEWIPVRDDALPNLESLRLPTEGLKIFRSLLTRPLMSLALYSYREHPFELDSRFSSKTLTSLTVSYGLWRHLAISRHFPRLRTVGIELPLWNIPSLREAVKHLKSSNATTVHSHTVRELHFHNAPEEFDSKIKSRINTLVTMFPELRRVCIGATYLPETIFDWGLRTSNTSLLSAYELGECWNCIESISRND